MIFVYIIIGLVLLARIIELHIANRNEKWMKSRGAIEIGKEHYKYFIMVHVCFFLSLLLELQFVDVQLNGLLFAVFLLAQIARVWCIHTLGKFWNTKIIVLPNVLLIKKGPYKYMKHPNYMIVVVELFVIPAMFGAYVTAILFPIFHLFLLSVRIPAEEKALKRI